MPDCVVPGRGRAREVAGRLSVAGGGFSYVTEISQSIAPNSVYPGWISRDLGVDPSINAKNRRNKVLRLPYLDASSSLSFEIGRRHLGQMDEIAEKG